MLRSLIKNILAGKALRLFDKWSTPRLDESLAVQLGRDAIHSCWTGNSEITKLFSGEIIKHHAQGMMEDVIKIATSPDPKMANREKLTSCVIEYAQFQVLILDPPPAEDPTGLREQPGITGELKAHLFELPQKDKAFREFMHAFKTPKNWDDVYNIVLGRYRIVHAWAHLFHTLRFAFDDVNHAEGKDWFKPYITAMCAWQEHQYRRSLGMPPSLDDSGIGAEARALMMSAFMNCVLSGARFPDLEWRERAQKIERDLT